MKAGQLFSSQKARVVRSERELHKHYAVYYNGKLSLYLSPQLAVKQNLTLTDLEKLRRIHIKRLQLFDKIEAEDDVFKLHSLANDLEEIEFELQTAWKFDRNAAYHSWWFMAPKCTCPLLDNKDRIGTGTFIINENCLLHGSISHV